MVFVTANQKSMIHTQKKSNPKITLKISSNHKRRMQKRKGEKKTNKNKSETI